ncbi:hypothetical protein E1264_03830 [Actinomadura sp. KC216]|uniref:hypothetical protein n=1 Tax=Actinomadura sp. KC216 TaxID=2530370 RepID=UPI0010516C9B|nr:hypothetical protein [Actinomadura sp. KC216]TDB90945.1 hypothetical protein E1264_03830 [Actinomadura sp. KC216]
MASVKFDRLEIFVPDGDDDVAFDLDPWGGVASVYVKRDELVKALQDLGIVPANTEENYGFYGAVLKYVRENWDSDAVKILDVRQETRETGYCETCYEKYDVVYVDYEDKYGDRESDWYYGDMEEFMRRLTD